MTADAIQLPLPFRITAELPSVAARIARLTKEQRWTRIQDPYANTALEGKNKNALPMEEYFITKQDIMQVYLSSNGYHAGFNVELNLKKFDDYQQPCAGMRFRVDNKRLLLSNIVPWSSAARSLDGEAECKIPSSGRLETLKLHWSQMSKRPCQLYLSTLDQHAYSLSLTQKLSMTLQMITFHS